MKISSREYRGAGRYLMYLAKRIGIPMLTARRLVKGIKILLEPGEYLRRRRLARALRRAPPESIYIDRVRGYGFFTAEDVPETKAALETLRSLARTRIDLRSRGLQGGGKQNLIDLIEPVDFEAYPEILRFALSPVIVEALSQYLGTVPVLASVRLWWSPPNDSVVSSQLFHIDKEDFHQAKLFLNIEPVDQDTGPLTFIPADLTRAAVKALRHRVGRVQDDDIYNVVEPENTVCAVGPAGHGIILDTSACFHYGSRQNKKSRLVLMMQYCPYHMVIEPYAYLPMSLKGKPPREDGLALLAFALHDQFFVPAERDHQASQGGME